MLYLNYHSHGSRQAEQRTETGGEDYAVTNLYWVGTGLIWWEEVEFGVYIV